MANYVSRLPGMVDDTEALIRQSASDAVSMREQTKQELQQAAEL
jgi:predicted ABC-class ATPase